MKKSIILYLSVFIANAAWGDNCVLTDHMLDNGGNFDYDDYLYADTQQYELRKEGKSGVSYLCGQGYCDPGTKIRLSQAAVGSPSPQADSVYECVNKSTVGRTSYQWVRHSIQTTCTVNPPLKAEEVKDVINGGELYKVTNGYCAIVSEQVKQTNGWDFANTVVKETNETIRTISNNHKDVLVSGINGGVEIITNYSDNKTQRIKVFYDNTVKVVDIYGKTINGRIEILKDGFVKLYDSTGRTLLGGLKITTDGIVSIVDTAGKTIVEITQAQVDAYKATLQFFTENNKSFQETIQVAIKAKAQIVGIAIQETGATARTVIQESSAVTQNMFNNGKDIVVKTMDSGVMVITTVAKENTKRIELLSGGVVKVAGKTLDTAQIMWRITTNGAVEIYDKTADTILGGFRLVGKGAIEVLKTGGSVVNTITQETGESYRETLRFFINNYNSFNDTVKSVIKDAANVAGITIQEFGEFARHFTSEIIGGVKAYQINKQKLKNLEERIAKCTTQEQVAKYVEEALREAELNDKQIAQVRSMINDYARQSNQRFDVIENKINKLEEELIEIKAQNNVLAVEIEKLGGNYRDLASQVRTKVNAKQVITLITQYTQNFSDGQTKQLYKILEEYTEKLSPGQKAEVQGLIAAYVDPKVAMLNSRIDMESERRAAENKVLSAMSVLNTFASSADVSVWKTADGKFNGVRLASDMTAGVVLGTVGGVVSGVVIKKKQVEKGFDALYCAIGGQAVADYEDEFVVGIQ